MTAPARPDARPSFRRHPEALIVVGYFVLRPLELLLVSEPTLRYVVVYGLVAPLVGLLLAARHGRARFAAYVALSMEIVRSTLGAQWIQLAAAAAILLLLQLPRTKRVWPRIDPRRLAVARLRG
jgi:hypothetical protein